MRNCGFKIRILSLTVIGLCLFTILISLCNQDHSLQPQSQQKKNTPLINNHHPSSYPIILYWTHFHGRMNWLEKEGVYECGGVEKYKCYFTSDKNLFYDSSLVVFDGCTSSFISFILSLYEHHNDRPMGQRWVYASSESPTNMPVHHFLKRPLFNWTMSYRQESDVIDGYADILTGRYQDGFDPLKNYLEGKDIEITAVISNCLSLRRLMAVRALSKHIEVNLMGVCSLKPKCTAEELKSNIKRSKFYLAFENSICKDYITEKTYRNAFSNGAVPVIMSGANLSNPLVIPQGSYIDATKFNSAKELADHLKYIGSSKERYNKFFEWRDHLTIRESSFAVQRCHLCEKLHKSSPSDIKVYEDLSGLYDGERECKPYLSW